jgi:signal transduction histidine kinase
VNIFLLASSAKHRCYNDTVQALIACAWMLRFTVLVLCLFVAFRSPAQAQAIIFHAAPEQYVLGAGIEYLEDASLKLSIHDVLTSKMQQRFQPIQGSYPNFSYTTAAYWLRFTLIPTFDHPTAFRDEWLLAAYYPSLEYVDYYVFTANDSLSIIRSGATVALHSKPLQHRYHLAVLPAWKRGDSLRVYVRVASRMTAAIPLELLSERRFLEKDRSEMTLIWLYFGIAVAMVCYNGFLCFALRDRAYLLYVCYIICYAGFIFVSVNALVFQYLPEFKGYVPSLVTCTNLCGNIFALLFARIFLRLDEYSPHLHRLLLGVVSVHILALVAQWFVPIHVMHRSLNLIAVVVIALMFSVGAVAARKRFRPARFFLAAWTVFLLGGLTFILSNLGILPKTPLVQHSIQLGSALEMLLLSLALADRIALIRHEREEARAIAAETLIVRRHAEEIERVNTELAVRNEDLNRQQSILNEQVLKLENVQSELWRQHDLTVKAMRRAEESEELKNEFLGNLNHEVRTPLTAIRGFSEVLRMHTDSKEARGYIDCITAASDHLTNLFGDLLQLSKMYAGPIECSFDEVQPHAECQVAIDFFAHEIEQKHLDIRIVADDAVPMAFVQDAAKFRQVLIHLMSNAVKFTHEGSIELRLAALDKANPEHGVIVEIEDTGVGIAADKLHIIFEAFRQQDGSTTRTYGGLGIGLTICRLYVQAMGGTIEAASTVGRGTTFSVRFPMLPARPHGSVQA